MVSGDVVVGLIAAAIEILRVAEWACRHVKTLCNARQEFSIVQSQLQSSFALIRRVEYGKTVPFSIEATACLQKAEKITSQISNIAESRILRKDDEISQLDRWGWLKNKSQILDLQKALKECMTTLNVAMTLDGRYQTSKTQLMLEQTHQAMLFQSTHVLQDGSGGQASSRTRALAWKRGHAGTGRPIFNHRSQPEQQAYGSPRRYLRRHQICPLPKPHYAAKPRDMLEGSRNFFPESYAIYQQLSKGDIRIVDFCQLDYSASWKVNLYQIMYFTSARNWCNLSISLQIHRASSFWKFLGLADQRSGNRAMLSRISMLTIPSPMLAQLCKLFSNFDKVWEGTHLVLTLSKEDDIKIIGRSLVQGGIYQYDTLSELKRDLRTLRGLNCRRFTDGCIARLAVIDAPRRFISCVEGTLVIENRFAASSPTHLYNIQFLDHMSDYRQFAKLYGILTDVDGKYLKGYLVALPTRKWSRIQDEMLLDRQIPWSRREKWARQIVGAVAAAHLEGFAIGSLILRGIGFVLDAEDNITIARVEQTFQPATSHSCYYPREFRHLLGISCTTDLTATPKITTQTDIYHLGWLLWHIAECHTYCRRSPVCLRNGCDDQIKVDCDDSHRNPILLPRLSEAVPLYFRDMVDACRRADPKDRPSAGDLSGRFPTTDLQVQECTVVLKAQIAGSVDEITSHLRHGCTCDICSSRIPETTYYVCATCCGGDFDLCQLCYDQGLHCRNPNHLMIESHLKDSWPQARRYHSSVQSSGQRVIHGL